MRESKTERHIQTLVHGKTLEVDALITHKLPLNRTNEAFDIMHEGKSIRTLITM